MKYCTIAPQGAEQILPLSHRDGVMAFFALIAVFWYFFYVAVV